MVIRIEGLKKEYNGFKALKNLDLTVKEGEIYGFLGPNGAGKTTTILLLLDIIRPSAGKVFLFEKQLTNAGPDIRRRVGVVSERQYLYKDMTAWEYLDFFGHLYNVDDRSKKIRELLGELNLADEKNKLLGAFSRGMQQKIGFARAFLHNPDLLILDEPISGLDPNGIKQVRDLLARANSEGKTIFISSHLLSEVEKLCRKVGVINKGQLLAQEKMQNLKRRLQDEIEMDVELVDYSEVILGELLRLDFVRSIDKKENSLSITVDADKDYRAQISEAISKQGGVVLSIAAQEMSLEDAFIEITSKNISLLNRKGEKQSGEWE